MRTFLFLLCCCECAWTAAAPLVQAQAQVEPAVGAFDEGNIALENGAFEEALADYQKAQNSGFVSAALYHNMALASFRMDDLGHAILFLERAGRIDPNSPAISHSLSVARSMTQDHLSRLGTPFLKIVHQWIVRRIPVSMLFGIGLVAWILFTVLTILHIMHIREGSWWRRGRTWSGVFAVLLLAFSLYSSIAPPFDTEAVVLADESPLYEQPSRDSGSEINVHEGLVVVEVGGTNQWRLVQLPNGTRGWLPENQLERI